MALSLNLSTEERNDSKVITITDISTGWGTDTDPSYTVIKAFNDVSAIYSLILTVTINSVSGTTVYDPIDLYTINNTPFATQADMVFPINASILKVSSQSIGDSNTLLPDGIWDISYTLKKKVSSVWTDYLTKTVSVLVYGQVQKQVYDKLRLVPEYYDSKKTTQRNIQESLLYYTFLQSIEKNAYIAKKEQLLEMLETLQRLLLNGSNYPW